MISHPWLRIVFCLFVSGLMLIQLQGKTEDPLSKGPYDENIPPPEKILGIQIGERPLHHSEAIRYLKSLAGTSEKVIFSEIGRTHENRLLGCVMISSEKNSSRLEQIRQNISGLSDPRTLKSPDEVIESTPAIAWMMYTIHGDELSGTDASIQLAYQLAAGKDSVTLKILDELVVGIVPMQNPDGRERYLAQMDQWSGQVPNSDRQCIQHTGVWPWGRGNHYLFDLNRDWCLFSQPETKAMAGLLTKWIPQLMIDAHEMGADDTYLFNPPGEPINPNIPATVRKWWNVFSKEQAEAFDRHGWSYYTRGWYDFWYPGYGNSWISYLGTVGILYEQASTDGTLVKRSNETISTFQDAVNHQVTSSLANLETAAHNRTALLHDFYLLRKQALSGRGAFYIIPSKNHTRVNRLIETLLMQDIELEIAQNKFTIAASAPGAATQSRSLPEGTLIIRTGQPGGFLVRAILEFDPRLGSKVLQREREYLEKGKGTKLYDVTAWSLLLAYGVEAYYSVEVPKVNTLSIEKPPETKGTLKESGTAVAYLCDYTDDLAVHALLSMLQKNMKVRAAKEPFEIEGRSYPRGTLLLRVNENGEELGERLTRIAEENQVNIFGVRTLRSQEGPDLGGRDFELLVPPRIALLSGQDMSGFNVGATWYLLDNELKQRFSLLNLDFFSNFDLRKYNVLVMPSIWGGPKTYQQILGKEGIQKLKTWVSQGGTLIGISDGAAFLADSSTGISEVRLYRQVLKELDMYREANKNRGAWRDKIDSLAVWEGTGRTGATAKSKPEKQDLKILTHVDEMQRLYQPRGAILRVKLADDHWINYGLDTTVSAIMSSAYAYLSKKPVQTAAWFSKASRLRVSGLLWPEARPRWAETAYATREKSGDGQIILFADEPNFRAYFYGTTRMLINSMILGPGMGTRTPGKW